MVLSGMRVETFVMYNQGVRVLHIPLEIPHTRKAA